MAVLPIISAVAGLASAGIGAVGAMRQGEANAAAANYQAQVAANNAAIERQNAEWEFQSGEVQTENVARNTRNVVGTTKAAQAASGVEVNTGSNVDVRAAESELGALDALTVRSNAARRAYSHEVAATGDEAQAQLLRSEADSARSAGRLSALGSFIGGIGSVAGKFKNLTELYPTG
jgi:hypothetical protein